MVCLTSCPSSLAFATAWSTISLRLTSLLPLQTPSAVTTILHLASFIRSARESLENPAKTIECTIPRRVHANMATTSSGIMGM
uniref:Putative secreted protein n=1 Tax=Ixodes ricinus TaxID=34613 RepID=A0A6B0U312_IXORI